ncbi:MAG: hypothetical protein WCE94_02175 [Candidatus Methanoperedens sp.]
MNYSDNIVLELTIKNNLDYWASINGGDPCGTYLQLDLYNDKLNNNGRDYENRCSFASSFFIKPRDEIKQYIPFSKYNEINKDNRLGDWRISPKLNFYSVNFYRSPSDSNYIYNAPPVNSPITGNDLQFNVHKPEPTTATQEVKSSEIIPKGLEESIFAFIISIISNTIVQFFATVLAGLILVKYVPRGRKKR